MYLFTAQTHVHKDKGTTFFRKHFLFLKQSITHKTLMWLYFMKNNLRGTLNGHLFSSNESPNLFSLVLTVLNTNQSSFHFLFSCHKTAYLEISTGREMLHPTFPSLKNLLISQRIILLIWNSPTLTSTFIKQIVSSGSVSSEVWFQCT